HLRHSVSRLRFGRWSHCRRGRRPPWQLRRGWAHPGHHQRRRRHSGNAILGGISRRSLLRAARTYRGLRSAAAGGAGGERRVSKAVAAAIALASLLFAAVGAHAQSIQRNPAAARAALDDVLALPMFNEQDWTSMLPV